MRMNCTFSEPIRLRGIDIEEVDEFPYLGSKMTFNRSCDEESKPDYLSLYSQAFGMLNST